jgi:hypothetical protein
MEKEIEQIEECLIILECHPEKENSNLLRFLAKREWERADARSRQSRRAEQ